MGRKIIGVTVGTPTKPKSILDKILPSWVNQPTKPKYTASEVGAASAEKVAELSEAIADQQTEIDGKQPKGDYALSSELAAETTAREQAVASLNARLGQQTVFVAEGETQSEAEAWLETNGDKTKLYLMPDETFWLYTKTTEIIEGGASYTNVLPLAKETDRTTIYNGKGYSDGGKRLSSSGSESTTSVANNAITGFITDVKVGDVVRIKNFWCPQNVSDYVISYNSSNTKVNHKTFNAVGSEDKWSAGTETWYTVADGITTIVLTEANFGTGFDAIRFSGVITADTIVTINQEIKEGGGTTTTVVEKWASTGHGLVATNYDSVIADLTSIVTAHTAEIVDLKDLTEQQGKDIELLKEAVENGASGGGTSGGGTSGGSSGNTNLLPTAVDTDGSIYNGIGYKPSTRLSGSSGITASSQEAMCASGFMPASNGNIIKIKGSSPVSGVSSYLITYNSSKSIIKYQSFAVGSSDWSTANQDWYTYADGVLTIVLTEENFGADIAFFRFNAHMDENTVVTVTSPTSSGGGNNTTILTPEEALALIRNWDKPVYERLTPFLLDTDLTITNYPKSYTDSQDSDGSLRRQNVQAVYDEYNALCTAHPDFVRDVTDKAHGLDGATETTFGGICSDGIQKVRVYEFCEREGRHSNTTNDDYWSETKPTFIIVTGIHWEYNGVYSMLNALKIITENPEFRDMRRNCRFIVLPMSNPYCFTTYSNSGGGHYNANGVEIHNNFKVDFNNTIDSTHGTAPLSEIETRYIDNAMRKYADTGVCLLTCHSNASKGSNFIWGSVATKFMCNVSLRLVDLMSYAWDAKYDNYRTAIDTQKNTGSNPQEDGDYRCGFASLSTSTGTETKQALWYGMQGINVEVYEKFYLFDPDGTDVSLAVSRGAEVYANLLRLLAVTYDHNDRDKYAPNPPYKSE